jgi:transposase
LPGDTRLREDYLDESYIHEHYHRYDDSLWDPSDDQDIQIGKLKHKGRRYCFLAAIQGPDPRVEQPSPIRKEKAGLVHGSLWSFSPQKKGDSKGDYLKVFNSVNFITWWKEQLLPNLHQPSLIMMDNAKYHKTYPKDIPKVSKLRKAELQAFLERKSIAYGARDTVAILSEKARDHIEKREKRECEALAEEQGHKVLWTPPYHSDIQPIELLWARIKGEVGRQYDIHSTFALVYERLMASFDRVFDDGHGAVGGMIDKAAKIALAFYKQAQADNEAIDPTAATVEPTDDQADEDEEDGDSLASSVHEDADDLLQGASDGEASYEEV